MIKSKLTFIFVAAIILAAVIFIVAYISKYEQPKFVPIANDLRQTAGDIQEPKPVISGWKVYESKAYGFRIDYPSEWAAKESVKDSVVSFVNPEILKFFEEEIKGKSGIYSDSPDDYFVYNSDISVFRYPSSKLEERHGVKTIEEITENSSGTVSEVGKTKVGDMEATDFIWRGEGEVYVMIFGDNGYFYEIVLNRVSDRKAVPDDIKKILSTFRFVK